MEGLSQVSRFNQMLSFSSKEILKGHEELIKSTQVISGKDLIERRKNEEKIVQKLLSNLENATQALDKEIESGRIIKIEPLIFEEMKNALNVAMGSINIVDARVKEIYFSIFGWNTRLWHALNRMQRLLMTVDLKNLSQGVKVTKVEKSEKGRRKKRGQK